MEISIWVGESIIKLGERARLTKAVELIINPFFPILPLVPSWLDTRKCISRRPPVIQLWTNKHKTN